MRHLLFNILYIGILIFTIPGCKKNFVISEKQVILFQYDYVNFAWGYQQHGFVIDNEGDVLIYHNPEAWNYPDKEFILTEKQVTDNLEKCTDSGKKIPKDELRKYSGFISNIASSKITAPKNQGADQGSIEFLCYQFSESTGTYKGTLIKMEGDVTCENLNFYSKKVTAWMREIYNSIPHN